MTSESRSSSRSSRIFQRGKRKETRRGENTAAAIPDCLPACLLVHAATLQKRDDRAGGLLLCML